MEVCKNKCIVCFLGTMQKTKCCSVGFCNKCVQKWYERCANENLKFSCPQCRKALQTSTIKHKKK